MRTGRKPGFTLIELVITVVIVIVVATITVPVFSQIMARQRLMGALERIANDLRYVQSLAVTQGVVHRLHSGDDGAVGRHGEYRLERDNGLGGWTPIGTWYNPARDYNGIDLVSVTDAVSTPIATFDVRFNAQGALANGMGINYPIAVNFTSPSGAFRQVMVLRSGVVRIP